MMVIDSKIRNIERDFNSYAEDRETELIHSDYSRDDLARMIALSETFLAFQYVLAASSQDNQTLIRDNIFNEMVGNFDETSPAYRKYIEPHL